ncbi:MAG: site-2 protease family protein [Oscillibacter sp.]|nr:site-2 protease family protein [Oscillibacter sp.]
MSTIIYILAAILIFGFLIASHEFGHCVVAKLCGVQVNEYSIGMGPLIWQKQGKETLYSLRAVPFGGYCAMEGEDEDTGNERSFVRQKAWKKFLILVAGAFMNFLTGVVIILALYSGAGAFLTDEISGFADGFPLEGESGLMPGDVFYKIDGYRTYVRGDASLFLSFHKGDTIDLTVIRDGQKVTLNDFPMTRQTYAGSNGEEYTGFGLYVGVHAEEATFANKLRYTWLQALDFVQLVRFSLAQLFTGGASVKDLTGPVGIVSTMTQMGEQSETARDAAESILYFAALLAVNLAVMNLLPFPALDGGRVLFLFLDQISIALFRKPVPEKYQMAVNAAGMAALLTLMLLVTVQDVIKLFKG